MERRIVAVVILLAVWNIVGNTVVPDPLYVPGNLAIGALAVVLTGPARDISSLLGLERRSIPAGIRFGLAVATALVLLVIVAAVFPWSRRFFDDERFVDLTLAGGLYQTAVRIPLGTALFEELMFRGVLYGALTRTATLRTAAGWSSLLFGLWHVIPTMALLDQNPAGGYAVGGIAATGIVIAGVMVTAAAGLGFVWLRERSGSLVAPVIVHAAINSTAFVIGWVTGG